MLSLPTFTAALVLSTITVLADDLPSSYPHQYPNAPKGGFSAEWQSYFQVTESLPNVTFPLSRNFAGNLPVERASHPNNTLFFWGFESKNGSLTASAGQSTEPWAIWLNGGPGSSSMLGMHFENGPIRVNSDDSISSNPKSWDKLVDYFWLDQPVGVGFATADAGGYVIDEDQMGRDFFGFLSNLVKVFPSLATRPLYLTGESYAGVYIPYIMKTYFALAKPPVTIAKIVIGDGSIGAWEATTLAPVVSVIDTYPQLIGYDPEVYNYFKQQQHLCNYDINLTYPMTATLPTLAIVQPDERTLKAESASRSLTKRSFLGELEARAAKTAAPTTSIAKRHREQKRDSWKRDLTARAKGSIDTWYGCMLFDEILDYASNFTYPWTVAASSVDYYNIPSALYPAAPEDGATFLNNERTRAALHAPTSKDWVDSFPFTFGNEIDPSPAPMVFLSELATNLTAHGIAVVLYSGNADLLLPHFGTEITIQNTTFGGNQGFTRKPSTHWSNDDGSFAGIVHQERNWTYVLFDSAGHLVPSTNPDAAFTFLREFVLGTNQTGSVVSDNDVIGGEDPTFAGGIISGGPEVFVGAGATQTTYLFPAATTAAWGRFRAAGVSALEHTQFTSDAPRSVVMAPITVAFVTMVVGFMLS